MQSARLLRCFGLALVLGSVLAGSFFRGLFFWFEALVATAAVAAGFGCWIVGRRMEGLSSGIPGGVPGAALLSLAAAYLVQFPWAVFPRGNLDWVLRTVAAWFAFVIFRAESGPQTRRWVGWAVLVGSSVIAAFGLLEFTGYFAHNAAIASALSTVGLSDRLYTVYQYPNTGAAVFFAGLLVGIGLALDQSRPWVTAVIGGAGGLISLAFFFTLSRGVVVILPFATLVLLIRLDAARIWRALLLLGAFLLVPIAAGVHGVAAALPNQDWVQALRWILVSMAAGSLGGLGLACLFRLGLRVQAALMILLLLMAAGGLRLTRYDGPLIPSVASRLLDINFRALSVVNRIDFNKDAAKMVRDRPLGYGGWGWDRTYRRYQSYNYTARETHDHYAQTAVEAGLPGLLALLTAIIAPLWLAFRYRQSDHLQWAMAAGAWTIAAHALVDFDLSFLSVWLLLWILLAAASPPPPPPQQNERASRWLPALISAGVVAVLATLLAAGTHFSDRAAALAAKGDEQAARRAADLSRRFDPLNTQALQAVGSMEALERAVSLDPNHGSLWRALSIKRELARDFTGATAAAREALRAEPSVTDHYERVIRLTGYRLDEALGAGDVETARATAAELVTLGQQFGARKEQLDGLHHFWPAARKMEWTKIIYLHVAKGLCLTGDAKTAEAYLKLAATEWTYATEADIWLHALLERQGRVKDLTPMAEKPWIRFRSHNPVYRAILNWKP